MLGVSDHAICSNYLEGSAKSWEASLVWIWLGEPADNSDLAMDLIRKAPELNLDDPSYFLDPVAWSAVKTLLGRPWWERLWVVQEALLSKKATLNCGFQAADLQCVVRLKDLQTKYLTAPPEPRFNPMRSSLASAFGLLLLRWNDIKALMAKDHATVKEIVDATGEAKCSLSIDKIYGIMSICNAQDRQNIPIDYRCCTACLVLKVAKYNFRKFEMFGPLAVLQTHQVKDPNLRIPSWVPDYTTYDYESHFVFPESEECTPFRAAADNAAWVSLGLAAFPDMTWFLQSVVPADQLKILREQVRLQKVAEQIFPQIASLNSMGLVLEDEGTHNTLVLLGLMVDFVTTVYATPSSPHLYTGPDLQADAEVKKARREAMIGECQKWRKHIRNDSSASSNPYNTLAGREEAFWRTLIADRDLLWRGPPAPDFASRFEAWLGNGDRAHDEGYAQPYGDTAVVHCMYRSFFITKKGYFGLGRAPTRPGDVACVLRGGNVPFTLRSRENGYYEFIGETYLHGVMDGSFVRNARKEDLQTFKIR
jgi:Heterokaryon incompatibility protein (HET)